MTPEHQVLRPTAGTVTDAFDPSLEPVLTVEPGERFTVEALDAHGFTRRPGHPGAPTPRLLEDAEGHCLTGPVTSWR